MPTNDPPKPKKIKVKTACRTCKARKIKCDEARPACRRCVSTGRKCEGYGIWDRPVPPRPEHARCALAVDQRNWLSTAILPCSSRDQQCLEWFLCHTVTKLPGTFRSLFWDKLLLQASFNERALFHAILALGSVSKDGDFTALKLDSSAKIGNQEEQSTTRHYLQSIGHLKEHFLKNDSHSVRVILIACITFVCLDFLRGHFEAGQSHLRRGLKVLRQTHHLGEHCVNYDDDWILEVFARLDLMVKLFPGPTRLASTPTSFPVGRLFLSDVPSYNLKQAWKDLQHLLNKILALAAQPGPLMRDRLRSSIHLDSPLVEQQREIAADLQQWLQLYRNFVDDGDVEYKDELAQKVHHILYAYHHMADIMLRTALHPGDEMVFDKYTHLFELIIHCMCNLRRIIPARYESVDEEGLKSMHEFLSDLGWIAPLYYTASRCRHHRIRLQAIKLLESSFHREGIWDSVVMARVARKIMILEERDFFQNLAVDDNFELTANPLPTDLKLPTIPDAYRLRDVEVVLSGAPMDEVQLFSGGLEGGLHSRAPLSIYSVHTGSWRDLTAPRSAEDSEKSIQVLCSDGSVFWK